MKLFLPNGTRLQNIEGFLRRFDASDPSRLDFSMHDRWVFLHPAALAFAACVADAVTAAGGQHYGTIHKVASLPYLIRMGLFDHVKLPHPGDIIPHEEAGRFIPLTRIRNTTELSAFIVNMIPLLHASPTDVEPIRYVISEMVRNVLEHSDSANGAILCAQYFRDSKIISLGVADAGIGIHQAMNTWHTVPTPWDAIALALRPGVSGTTPRIGGTAYNAGAGLFFTKCIACASRNYFVVYSGNAMFKLRCLRPRQQIYLYPDPRRDHHTKVTDLPPWNGTLIGIDISLDQGKMFAHLMKLIRDAYSLHLKEEKKTKYGKAKFT